MTNKMQPNAAETLIAKRVEIKEQIKALKADAAGMRSQIGELIKRRDELVSTPVSKDEYIRLACAWVDRKADAAAQRFVGQILRNSRNGIAIPTITRIKQDIEPGRLPGLFTHGDYSLGTVVSEESLFMFMRGPIKAALRGAVTKLMDWPFKDVIEDVDAALNEIVSIDAELVRLNADLTGLVELGASFGETV